MKAELKESTHIEVDAVETIDQYFERYGKHHVAKANKILSPLHQPGLDPLPDMSLLTRQPYEPQAHVIAAGCKMLDEVKKGIIVGQMGVGKTIIGSILVNAHASQSLNRGGRNGRYRAVILCPDHLIDKWKDEILSTIPGSKVFTFDNNKKGHKQIIKDLCKIRDEISGGEGGRRWKQPDGPEWYIVGKNQAKFLPDKAKLGEPRDCGFDGNPHHHLHARPYYNKSSLARTDKDGNASTQLYFSTCPKCGGRCKDDERKGFDVSLEKKHLTCERRYAIEIPEEGTKAQGRDIMLPLDDQRAGIQKQGIHTLPFEFEKLDDGHIFELHGKRWMIRVCGERLWGFTSDHPRWPPGEFMSNHMKGAFHYLLLDECHEHKSSTAAQAVASGKLVQSIPHVIAMTGTLIGGYASHLFPTLFRMCPRQMIDAGFEWGKVMPFVERYGRIETTIKTTTDKDGNVKTNRTSMRLDGEDTSTGSSSGQKVAPGIMPALFGHMLIERTVFLSLSEMSDNLPSLTEFGVEPKERFGPEDHHFWVDGRIEMAPDQHAEYKRIEGMLVQKCQDMLVKGNMKLLGTLLATTLGYSDRPWNWDYPEEIQGEARKLGSMAIKDRVGHWGEEKNKTYGNWVGVVTPRDLDQDVIYPKEKTLIEICQRENLAGNQTWVYVQMTDKRDVQPRLQKLLEAHGLRVNVLRAKSVQTRDRMKWIDKMGPKSDVIISHPQPVETGLDFFSKKKGGHNFNSICFYQTGYNLNTMRQASARGWRLGQPKDCRVYYLFYQGTAQESAMRLVARKMMAAKELDGDLSVEGLSSMVDSSSEAMALARSISNKMADTDIARNWVRIGQKSRPPVPGIDILPLPIQMATQVIHDAQPEFDFGEVDFATLAKQYLEAVRMGVI